MFHNVSAVAARVSDPHRRRLLGGWWVGAARRFGQQVFLSVDVPPSFMALGDGPRLVLAVERAVVDYMKSR